MNNIYTLVTSACIAGPLALAGQLGYTVTDLGTLGGTASWAYGINNGGMVAGGAETATQTGPTAQTAFLWSRGKMVNLGTLGGAACPGCSSEGAAASANGDVAVISETAQMDPNGEDFCGFGTHHQCVAAMWSNGKLTALPLLQGGQNSQTYWMNSKGEAVGMSEYGTFDSTCTVPFQIRRYLAAKWTRDGKVQALPTLPGDTVGFAFQINDEGQVVGVSGLCSNVTLPPFAVPNGPHAVLWQKDGTPVNLGTLPGGVTTVPTTVNNRGDVVGNVQFSDGSVHAFLWNKRSGMHDLGVPDGDFVSVVPCCGSINNRGDIVGFSCPGPMGACRAIIRKASHDWVDLNDLVKAGSPLYLLSAASINDSGQIVGYGMTSGGDVHAFLASPSFRDDD